MTRLFIMLALTVATSTTGCPQAEPSQPRLKESPVQLLPGYRYTTENGIDSSFGRIWKDGGPEINYDFGVMSGEQASVYAEQHPGVSLTEAGSAATGKVVVALDEEHDAMVVSIDHRLHFHAHNVRTRKDVVDVLLIAHLLARMPPK